MQERRRKAGRGEAGRGGKKEQEEEGARQEAGIGAKGRKQTGSA